MASHPILMVPQPMPKKVIYCRLLSTSEYEGLLVWSKVLVWHAGNAGVWLRCNICLMPALLNWSSLVNAIFERDPAQAQTAAAIVYGPAQRCITAGRSGQASIGHLLARCLSWSTPGVVNINFVAAGCHTARQGGAAGLRNIP
eukprot:1147567-Pelagomonas_calceolata.AAC.3